MSRHLVLQAHLRRPRPPRDPRAYVDVALDAICAEYVAGRLGALPVEALLSGYDLAMSSHQGTLTGVLRAEMQRRMGG